VVKVFFLRLVVFVLRRLPQRSGAALVRWLGRTVYRFSPWAEATRDNMWHVLGTQADPTQVAQLARKAFENRALNYYDMVRLSGAPLEKASEQAAIEGLEPILQLLEQKRGAVVVSAHIGPMEHMIQAISAFGCPLIGIAEHMQSEPLHQYIMGLRTAHGLDLISTKGSLLDVLRRVKKGEVLASAIDRDSTETGRILEFFGGPAWLPDGYARVAVSVNVPLVFAYCRRTGDGTVARVFPPIYPDRSLGKQQAVADVLARAVGQLEETIREDPAEWHLSTPVWRLAQERLEQGRLA